MSRKPKPKPQFSSEQEERSFWESHDSSEYVDWSKAKKALLPNLKLSTKSISIRLPEDLLERIKVEANRWDVPYQSLIKVWLREHTDKKAPWKLMRAAYLIRIYSSCE